MGMEIKTGMGIETGKEIWEWEWKYEHEWE